VPEGDPQLAAYLEAAAVPDAEFVDRLYRLVVRRDPEPDARARALAKLREGTLSRATLLAELTESDEFARVRLLDDATTFAAWARAADERPRELRAPPGVDERPIEIPWVLSRLRGEPRVLDVGYAFAEPAYLAALVAAVPEPVGVDLAEAAVPGLRAVVADVRELPFDDGAFDVAICVSTLEHVGRDNTVYGLGAERDQRALPGTLKELRRVLDRDGRLLVTVPCGEHEDHAWQVQLDDRSWLELFRSSGFVVFEHEVYELGADGWRSADLFSAVGVRYGTRGPGASAVLCAELHPATLGRRARTALRALRRG
jgi:SAM-dependent methyltransferase